MDGAQQGWEPVAGVDLVTYARVTALLLTGGATGDAAIALVAAHRVPPDAWALARAGWTLRIAADPGIRAAYAEHYRDARGRGV